MKTARLGIKLFTIFLLSIMVAIIAPEARAASWPISTCNPSLSCTGGKPNVTPGVSNLVTYPEIVMIFWDDTGSSYCNQNSPTTYAFSQQKTTPTQSQFIAKMLTVANGPYLAALSQYGTQGGNKGWIGRARVAPIAPVYQGCAPGTCTTANCRANSTTFSLDDLYNIVNCGINGGSGCGGTNFASGGVLPPLYNGTSTIYVLITANSYTSNCGHNGCNDLVNPGSTENPPYPVVLASVNSSNTNGVGVDLTLTHEISEAVSAYPFYVATNCVGGGQVADVCGSCNATVGGIDEAAYWSNSDGLCVVPNSWQGFQLNDMAPSSWVTPSGGPTTFQQLYGGGWGVVATDNNLNAWFFSGSKTGGSWSSSALVGAGSEMAAGGQTSPILYGLGQSDTDSAFEYNISNQTRTTLKQLGTLSGFSYPEPFTSIFSDDNPYVYATGISGELYLLDSAGNWVTFPGGYTFDQVYSYEGSNVVGMTFNRSVITFTNTYTLYTTGACSGCTWSSVTSGGTYSFGTQETMFANQDAAYFGFVWPTSGYFWGDDGTYGTYQNGGGDFAVTSAHNTLGTVWRWQWMDSGWSTNTTGGSRNATYDAVYNFRGNWSPNGGTAGRLIDGYYSFYATTCTSGPNCVNY